MQTLYLIRHGEPDFPGGEHMCIGRTDLALSPLGRMQAALLGFELAERVGRVYSSPLARARETAEGIAPAPELLPGLAEQDMGEWDGLRFSEIRRRWPELWARRESDKTIPMPGAEPDSAALSRFTAAVEGIFSRGGDAAAAAHSSVIRLYLNSLGAGMIKIPYGSYVVLHPGERPAPEEIGVLPHPELTDERCMALLRAAGNPGKVLRHCAAVAELASELARRLGMDAVKIRRAALLHDVARLLPGHAAVGARWLEALGCAELAPLVANHMAHPGDRLDEAGVVCLADKLVIGDRRCTVEERFAASEAKCTSPEARRAHAERRAAAMNLCKLLSERGVEI